mgnify:CR=1 FL=1
MATNSKAKKQAEGKAEQASNGITSKAELKSFLLSIRDKMTDETSPAIYSAIAMNHVLSLANIYDLLNKENKEIARDIWLRLKQAGLQLRNPPLLFTADEAV